MPKHSKPKHKAKKGVFGKSEEKPTEALDSSAQSEASVLSEAGGLYPIFTTMAERDELELEHEGLLEGDDIEGAEDVPQDDEVLGSDDAGEEAGEAEASEQESHEDDPDRDDAKNTESEDDDGEALDAAEASAESADEADDVSSEREAADSSKEEDAASDSDQEKQPEPEGKSRKGKGAHAASKSDKDKQGVKTFEEALAITEKRARKRRKFFKRLGIALGATIGVLGIAYLAGVGLFSMRYLPNTAIANMDISLKSPEEVQEEIGTKIGDYSLTIKGLGINTVITSEQAKLDIDHALATDNIMAMQNPWAWPIEIFQPRDALSAVAEAMSASGLAEALKPTIDTINEKATDPTNAAVQFNEKQNEFVIMREASGTKIDMERVLEQVAEAALNLQSQVIVTTDALVKPTIYKDDQRLAKAKKEANELIAADIDIMMEGNHVTDVDAAVIGPWVVVGDDFAVAIDEQALTTWAEEVAEACNTVGSTRVYTRPDGKEVEVSGGTYGWKIDSSELATEIIEAVNEGLKGEVDAPVLQSGNGFTSLGSQDWGARYVDVDISEQHARFYDSTGELVWETDIVTGARGSRSTPTGVFSINHKQSPTTLIGQMTSEGTPEYESFVNYWMPFKGNSVGLHDATWQSAFGGSRYMQGFGSHGCVNLPLSAARELYNMIEVGDVVVVHY